MAVINLLFASCIVTCVAGCVDQPDERPPPSQELNHFKCSVWRSCAGTTTVNAPGADLFVPTSDPQEAEIQWVGWCESQPCVDPDTGQGGGLTCHATCELDTN